MGKNRGYIDKVEVLGFIDGTASVDWIIDTGCRVMNLLCKDRFGTAKNNFGKRPNNI